MKTFDLSKFNIFCEKGLTPLIKQYKMSFNLTNISSNDGDKTAVALITENRRRVRAGIKVCRDNHS